MEVEDEFEELSATEAHELEGARIYFVRSHTESKEEGSDTDDSISDSSSSDSSDSSDSSGEEENKKERKEMRKKKRKEMKMKRKALRRERKKFRKEMKHKKEKLKKSNRWNEEKEKWRKEMFDQKHKWKKQWKKKMGWKEKHKFCIEVNGKLEKPGKARIVIAKEQGFNNFNQKFIIKDGKLIIASFDNYCLTVVGPIKEGAKLKMRPVDDDKDARQQWNMKEDSQNTRIVLTSNHSFCLQVRNARQKARLFLGKVGKNNKLQNFQLEPVKVEIKEEDKMEQVIKLLEQAGDEQEFEDPEFVASPESVGELLENKTEWKHAKQFLGPQHSLFDNIDPNDIIQGALGDCWLLSSLSVLAEHPHRVEKLFPKKDKNRWGLWAVSLYLDGVHTQVTTDDRFPVFKGTDTPCFSRNKGKELWVLLLEKVYAKLHGSYAAIEGGSPGDALSDLTGAPYETFRTNKHDPELLWKKMLQAEERKYLMCCAVPNTAGIDLQKMKGLVEGHAFSLLDVRNTSNGKRVVKIRNPWGQLEWNGDWSDGWSGWTTSLKKELGWEKKDDGIFWISYEDFLKYFSYVSIVYVHDNWHQTSYQTIIRKKTTCYALKVTSATKVRVSLHQKRGTPLIHNRIGVCNSSNEPVGGTSKVLSSAEVNSTGEMDLKPGIYTIVIDTYSGDAKKFPVKCNISAYSEKPVKVGYSRNQNVPFMLPSFVKQYGTCDVCHKVLSATCVSAIGQKFHPACFKCSKCKTTLGGSFYVRDNQPICAACSRAPALTCAGCEQTLSGQCFTVLGGKWHPQCFKCYDCKSRISGQFFALGKHPICVKCSKKYR